MPSSDQLMSPENTFKSINIAAYNNAYNLRSVYYFLPWNIVWSIICIGEFFFVSSLLLCSFYYCRLFCIQQTLWLCLVQYCIVQIFAWAQGVHLHKAEYRLLENCLKVWFHDFEKVVFCTSLLTMSVIYALSLSFPNCDIVIKV